MTDPKELNIPNICFSLSDDKNNEENLKYKKQRIERGFDDTETFSLDDTIAKFILPRLKRFKELSYKYVKHTNDEKERLDKMIQAFEIITDEHRYYYKRTDEDNKLLKEGLELFGKYFTSLWW